jgi:hypothetical protein
VVGKSEAAQDMSPGALQELEKSLRLGDSAEGQDLFPFKPISRPGILSVKACEPVETDSVR